MWVRGLKLIDLTKNYIVISVAPHVGAWIETAGCPNVTGAVEVAPHVGAWIETSS